MVLKSSTYIDFGARNNDKDPKSKVGDHVAISQNKNNFAKGYAPSWSEEPFLIEEVKNTVLWTYLIEDLNGEKKLKPLIKENCNNKSNRL